MDLFRITAVITAPVFLAGCVTTETVRFQPTAQQQAIVRDGKAALVSQKKTSIVMVSPAARQFSANRRPTYVVGINNLGKSPAEFRLSEIRVIQKENGQVV